MDTFSNDFGAEVQKEQNKYYCDKCNYKCSKKFNWERHLGSTKHIKAMEGKILEILETGKWIDSREIRYCCSNCNKQYCDRTGLWRHKKKCTAQNTNSVEYTDNQLSKMVIKYQTELINQLIEKIKDQTELKEVILELAKKMNNNVINDIKI